MSSEHSSCLPRNARRIMSGHSRRIPMSQSSNLRIRNIKRFAQLTACLSPKMCPALEIDAMIQKGGLNGEVLRQVRQFCGGVDAATKELNFLPPEHIGKIGPGFMGDMKSKE